MKEDLLGMRVVDAAPTREMFEGLSLETMKAWVATFPQEERERIEARVARAEAEHALQVRLRQELLACKWPEQSLEERERLALEEEARLKRELEEWALLNGEQPRASVLPQWRVSLAQGTSGEVVVSCAGTVVVGSQVCWVELKPAPAARGVVAQRVRRILRKHWQRNKAKRNQ